MRLLEQYGWNTHFEDQYHYTNQISLEPGRVVAIHRSQHTVITRSGLLNAQLSGAITNLKQPHELPKTGDWVLLKTYEKEGIILDVLPRANELSRKMPGRATEKQVLVANVDAVFIVQSLDRDFNIMRLQRYLQQVLQCGIKPIVVLNKIDLVEDPLAYQAQVHELGYSCEVVLVSAVNATMVSQWFMQFLERGKTYVLVGSSGVGKSTLLNTLLGYQLQQEGAVSEYNQKGRHTTTSRNLVLLENGSMIIDTPGMREFGLTLDQDANAYVHTKIEEFATECRIADCTHQHEPDCAVIDAVQNAQLPQAVYHGYLKMLREQYHYQENAQEKKRIEREYGKIVRKSNAHRKRYKY